MGRGRPSLKTAWNRCSQFCTEGRQGRKEARKEGCGEGVKG